ncbi:hypothetical protein KVT40_007586 [Elsinoe batatas]|uniref:C2H2-type domain-containing protein n=1 Tax=Elsinoe batatas TaxID=2601811 RepID=A0A8K0KXC6_9PEZI|nr:hypothetical protein KVT40_007586 [Elsinoe batatas]
MQLPEHQSYVVNSEHLGRNRLLSMPASLSPSPSLPSPITPTPVMPRIPGPVDTDDPLVCDVCGKKFSRAWDCRRHRATHDKSKADKPPNKLPTKPKKHSCDQCDYTATSELKINQHREAVHEGVTWKCRFCEKRANRQDGASDHEKKMHPQGYAKAKAGKPTKLDAQGREMVY